jgi:putative Holliday junction resolvase
VTLLLGVDLGERRIGLAVGDPRTGSARPLTTIARRDPLGDVTTLRTLISEHDISGLVVGLPLLADGSEGEQAARTRAWVAVVAPELGLPVAWQDERHTSQHAEMRIGGPGRGRAGGPPSGAAMRAWRGRLDREAAAAILQAALDATPTDTAGPDTHPVSAPDARPMVTR